MYTVLSTIARALDNWDNAPVLAEAAAFLENASRFDWSRRFGERAIALDPYCSADLYVVLAYTHMRDIESSSELGQELITQAYENTKIPALRVWMAALSDNEEDFDTWIAELSSDQSFEVQAAIANAYAWRGSFDEALLRNKNLAKNYSFDAQIEWATYCSNLMFLSERGKEVDLQAEVLPIILQLIERYPSELAHRSMLIRYHNSQKNAQAAIDASLEALALFPDDETTMYNLAELYDKQEDIDRAMLWCTRAIGAKYSFVAARCRLASYYEKLSKPALADEVMFEIPRVNPNYHFGKIRLAIYLHRTGRTDEALPYFREAYPLLQVWETPGVWRNEHGKALAEKCGFTE